MKAPRSLGLGFILLALSTQAGHAVSCGSQIRATQSRIDTVLWTSAARGPTATESLGALTHRQPTQHSVESAEQALGDIPTETVSRVRLGMSRARTADAAGDEKACSTALADVQQALNAEVERRGKQ